LLAGLAGGLLMSQRRPAFAVEQPARLVGLHRRAGWLAVSVSLRDLFRSADVERLRSGFVSRIVIRVELMRDGVKAPVARQDRRSEILFDLWDERFRAQVIDRRGRFESEIQTVAQAIEAATTLQRFDVASEGGLDPRAVYRLRFRADLNPLSEDLVSDVRRWLVRTPGQPASGSGDSMFGSFVSFFVNPRIEDSERQISFWSQPFSLPAPVAALPASPLR
jgi:hypothetical protein